MSQGQAFRAFLADFLLYVLGGWALLHMLWRAVCEALAARDRVRVARQQLELERARAVAELELEEGRAVVHAARATRLSRALHRGRIKVRRAR